MYCCSSGNHSLTLFSRVGVLNLQGMCMRQNMMVAVYCNAFMRNNQRSSVSVSIAVVVVVS